MSRRRRPPKREILPDPKFGNEMIAKFVNHVMSQGKKSIAEKIVYGALDIASEKLKNVVNPKDESVDGSGGDGSTKKTMSVSKPMKTAEAVIFEKAMENVGPTVEVRSRRVGGATYQVPIEVRQSRRIALAMRWIVAAARSRSEKTASQRLAGELVDAFQQKGSAIKKRQETHNMALANRAFAQYQW